MIFRNGFRSVYTNASINLGKKISGHFTTIKNFGYFHLFIFRLSNGRLLNKFGNLPCLILTTTGKKTGKKRQTPLIYLTDENSFICVASFGGNTKHPNWYNNLNQNPNVAVIVNRKTYECKASTLQNKSRKLMWSKLTNMYPNYPTYEKMSGRQLPVVKLTPKKNK